MTGRGRRPTDGPSPRGFVLLPRSLRSPGVPVVALLSAALWSLARSLTIVAFSWTVVSSIQSAFAVPLLFAVRALPGVIFGLFAGPAVDRLGSRPSVIGADSVSAACLIALMAISADGKLTFVLLLAGSATLGAMDTLRQTGTQSMIHGLARRGRAASALAAMNLVMSLAMIVGAALGGVLMAHLGLAEALGVTVVCLLGSLASAWRSPSPKTAARSGFRAVGQVKSPSNSMRGAFQLLRQNQTVRRLALVVALAEVLLVSSAAVLPAFTTTVLKGSATELGALTASISLGGVAILLVLTFRQVTPRYTLVVVALSSGGIALLAVSAAPSAAIAFLPLALLGAAISTLDTTTQSMLLANVGPHQRGAAAGIWVFAVGAAPAGQLLLGALVELLGVRGTLTTVGLLDLLIVVPLAMVSSRR